MKNLLIVSLVIISGCFHVSAQVQYHEKQLVLGLPITTLHGTYLYPEDKSSFPCVLIISGSGPTDRDGNSSVLPGDNNSLKMLAEALASQGIASLRYDKRGVGESRSATFSEAAIRFEDYIHDATKWINKLQQNDSISQLGVIGHSKGSLVGMIGAKRADADFFISLSGAGKRADSIIMAQLKNQPEELKTEAAFILQQLVEGKTMDDISPTLTSLFRPTVQPYLISWLQYDPQTEISKLEIPVLVVQGTSDLQVDTTNAQVLFQHTPKGEIHLIDSMNHVLKPTGDNREANVNAYYNPDLALSEKLIDVIVEFVDQLNDD